MMVGVWGMGADPVHINAHLNPPEESEHVLGRLERIGSTIMNRASGQGMFDENPLGAILSDRAKRGAAAQILGQAYVTAYALMAANRGPLEQIADTLVERKEMHGDEVVELLASVNLTRPQVDVMDESTWPAV
jgi:hypothetical protein